MMPATIIFSPQDYGTVEHLQPERYRFYRRGLDNRLEYITSRNVPILNAVTKEQYDSWVHSEMLVEEPRP